MIEKTDENSLGVVSNCWKFQLDAGEPLRDLVGRAVAEGFQFIELRQGCLGECEDTETRLPRVDVLASLAQQLPEITFDLAVELPIFSRSIDPASGNVRIMLEAAHALADDRRPAHLRIVDLVSKRVPAARSEELQPRPEFTFEDVSASLLNLQKELPSGVLSVEHSFQPWSGFRRLFEDTRLGGDSEDATFTSPKLCYDPCNFWLSGDGDFLKEITDALATDWLSMVHLKQRVGGSISTRAKYAGPFLFETAPSANMWECLADSRQCLAELIGQ
jgi:sugar phosphate isomerase/epimerase